LNRAAQVLSLTFTTQHFSVDTTGGEIVVAAHARVRKTLVMTQVQIGFRPIGGNKYFAMLGRTHGAWIHINVGIHFEDIDLELSGLELGCQRCSKNAFPEGRDNATRYKNISRH
jgi:hypothetical protein